jgi:hypothetical protein
MMRMTVRASASTFYPTMEDPLQFQRECETVDYSAARTHQALRRGAWQALLLSSTRAAGPGTVTLELAVLMPD